MVFPVLEQIKQKGKHHGAEVWGLLAALCVLDDLITIESLISQVSDFNQEKAWHGAIKVFVSNLKTPDLRDKCLKGLSVLIKNESFPIKLSRYVEQVFEQLPVSIDESIRNFLDAYINKISLDAGPHHLGYFFEYLSRISDVSPELCLEIVEKYLINLSAEGTGRIWKGEGLVSAIIQLLRWADTEDEPELIRRIIKIQDRLLELGWPGIEEALSRAERE